MFFMYLRRLLPKRFAPDEDVVVRDVWDGAVVGHVLAEAHVEEVLAELGVYVASAVVERGIVWVP